MELAEYFPIWEKLTEKEQALLLGAAQKRQARRGDILHNGSADCLGLFVLCSGQMRAFILSDEGKEVTLYRLFARDMCLFSASCMMQSIQFEITIEVEKDTGFWLIPPDVYKALMESSVALANYTNQLMAARFSEVMWLMEQILWKSFDKRLAGFLLTESRLEESATLKLTHDRVADHMGTAREVVTRMLRYFQQEGMVRLTRGSIELTDPGRLRLLANS